MKRTRREYLSLAIERAENVSAAAKRTGVALLHRWGDSRGGAVWPSQVVAAAALGISVRTFRRHVGELERAGCYRVTRSSPLRDHEGRYRRRRCNRYTARVPASPPQTPTSHLGDTGVPYTPQVLNHPAPRRGGRWWVKPRVTPHAGQCWCDACTEAVESLAR